MANVIPFGNTIYSADYFKPARIVRTPTWRSVGTKETVENCIKNRRHRFTRTDNRNRWFCRRWSAAGTYLMYWTHNWYVGLLIINMKVVMLVRHKPLTVFRSNCTLAYVWAEPRMRRDICMQMSALWSDAIGRDLWRRWRFDNHNVICCITAALWRHRHNDVLTRGFRR